MLILSVGASHNMANVNINLTENFFEKNKIINKGIFCTFSDILLPFLHFLKIPFFQMNSMFFRLLFVSTLSTFIACQSGDKKTNTTSTTTSVAQDSIAINNVIHGYFKWYNDFSATPNSAMDDFLNVDKNKKITLNPEGLEKYLAKYTSTGWLSKKWVDAERAYITSCARQWTTTEESLEGFDSDRCYCAQDGDFSEFATAPVSVTVVEHKATALIQFKPGSNNGENRKYELEKEAGKWLITKFDCATRELQPMVGGPTTASPMVDVLIDNTNNLLVNGEKATMDNLAKKIQAACDRVKANGSKPQISYTNESKTATMGFRQEVQTQIKEIQAKY